MIHPLANVESKSIGENTSIWQFVVVLKNAQIGNNCNINAHCFIENDVILGENVTVKCGVYLWDGMRIANNVFIGPNVTFINDNYPRSKDYPDEFLRTVIENGASIGAGSVILGGLTIGENSMIGAGSVLTKNVPANELWFGNPARFIKKIEKKQYDGLPITVSEKSLLEYVPEETQKPDVVFFSSAGTGTAYSAILSLRRNWGNSKKIIVADSNHKSLVTSSLLSDEYIQVPLNLDVNYKNIIIDILYKKEVNTYLPFIDEEIYIASLIYKEKFKTSNLKLQVKSPEIADICNDKYKTFLFLLENNILTPHCYLSNDSIQEKEAIIIKPRKGFGSTIINVSDPYNVFSYYSSEKYIVQQECQKPEITVDVCYDKSNNFFKYICRERIETKSGVCTKARLFYDKKIENIAFIIADKLDLKSFCFQLMKLKGDWAVTDINARLGAGTAMSVAVGMDFFSGMFATLWEQDPSSFFKPLLKETYVTRQYADFIMNM